MNTPTNPLTFDQFSQANATRCEASFHPIDDWSPSDWGNAMAGEVGEACNLIKKLRRLEQYPPGHPCVAGLDRATLVKQIGKELADLVTYADLTARRLGLSLGAETKDKFNEISDRVGSPIKL